MALAADPDHVTVGDRVAQVTREAVWTHVASIAVAVPAHHPQGMVRIGDAFFVSTVEVTRRREGSTDGGEGVGHLLHLDASGRLVRRVRLGEGAIYHPGGLDFDGTHLWVSVAEYRPDSRSIVYRVDPATLVATEVAGRRVRRVRIVPAPAEGEEPTTSGPPGGFSGADSSGESNLVGG